jgi:hypothetical protein|tara:strand:- start:1082 stop:1198 length:117 start_codon:yes stop_codon:yes gene_type:complete
MITFIEYWIWKIGKQISYMKNKKKMAEMDPFIYEEDDK